MWSKSLDRNVPEISMLYWYFWVLSYVYSEIEISKRIVGVNMIKWEAMIDYLRAK